MLPPIQRHGLFADMFVQITRSLPPWAEMFYKESCWFFMKSAGMIQGSYSATALQVLCQDLESLLTDSREYSSLEQGLQTAAVHISIVNAEHPSG